MDLENTKILLKRLRLLFESRGFAMTPDLLEYIAQKLARFSNQIIAEAILAVEDLELFRHQIFPTLIQICKTKSHYAKRRARTQDLLRESRLLGIQTKQKPRIPATKPATPHHNIAPQLPTEAELRQRKRQFESALRDADVQSTNESR